MIDELNVEQKMTKDAWFEAYHTLKGWTGIVDEDDFNKILRYNLVILGLRFYISIVPPTDTHNFFKGNLCVLGRRPIFGHDVTEIARGDTIGEVVNDIHDDLKTKIEADLFTILPIK